MGSANQAFTLSSPGLDPGRIEGRARVPAPHRSARAPRAIQ